MHVALLLYHVGFFTGLQEDKDKDLQILKTGKH